MSANVSPTAGLPMYDPPELHADEQHGRKTGEPARVPVGGALLGLDVRRCLLQPLLGDGFRRDLRWRLDAVRHRNRRTRRATDAPNIFN